MPDNQILYANMNGVCFFKFIGEVRHEHSGGLDSMIQSLFNNTTLTCHDVVVDLSEARYMDSTNLGLLAIIARNMLNSQKRKATLISTNEDMTTLLLSMCLDQAFNIIDRPLNTPGALSQITSPCADDMQRARMVLSAHEALIKLDASNRSAFQPVVDMLKQELS